jgi:hypothetical protein
MPTPSTQVLTITAPRSGAAFLPDVKEHVENLHTRAPITLASVGGTASAFTATATPTPASLVDGMEFWFTPNATPNAGSTLNISGLGAKNLATPDGTNIAAGAMVSGSRYKLVYDGTKLRVQTVELKADKACTISAAGLATGGGDLSADRTITVTAASSAEVVTGTETGKAVTPSALTGAVAAGQRVAQKGSDIASSSSIDLGAATGDYVDVTGTTTISALGTVAAGIERTVRFTGALTLTHNATSLILPGEANITTAAGDVAVFRSLGSGNWRCISYQPASAAAIPAGASAAIAGTATNRVMTPADDKAALDARQSLLGLSIGTEAAEYDADGIVLRRWGPEGEMIVSGDVITGSGPVLTSAAAVEMLDGDVPGHIASDGIFPLVLNERGELEGIPSDSFAIQVLERASAVTDFSTIVPLADVVVWSDSMAAEGSGWGADLATLFAGLRTVTTLGIGGQQSEQIAQRQGGYPILVNASANIPTSGTVNLTPQNGNPISGLTGINATLIGIEGTINASASPWVFTRTAAGDAVAVPNGSRVYLTEYDVYRNWTAVFVSGANDLSGMSGNPDDVALQAIVDVNISMVRHLSPRLKHFVFVGITSSSGHRSNGTTGEQQGLARVLRLNELLRDAVGEDHFIDMQAFMVNRAIYEAISDGLLSSGSYPTAQDLLDIAAGTIPASLRVDGTHYSTTGKQMAAKHVKRHLEGKGF